jgi:signal recognition particle receptor subunit beta
MAVFNCLRKEIDAKIVYYGPAVCGKTTNLQYIHQNLKHEQRGKMVSLATNEDRTLFFDFLPVELQSVRGFKTRFHLYTVPGQAYYGATRRAVLTGADGVVFVVDSQIEKLDENLFSLKDMEENLRYYGKRIETIPLVIQYNKRDLPNILPVEELNQKINRFNAPYFESVAITGKGVFETLTMACQLVLRAIEAGVEARRMAAAAPESPPEPQPRGLGKGIQRPEMPPSHSEAVSKAESLSGADGGGKPEGTPKRLLRLEKEEPAAPPPEILGETAKPPQPPKPDRGAPPPISPVPSAARPGFGVRPSEKEKPSGDGHPSPPGNLPGSGLRADRGRMPLREIPKPSPERPSGATLRLDPSTADSEVLTPPAGNLRIGTTLRPERPPSPPDLLPPQRDERAGIPLGLEKPVERIQREIPKAPEAWRTPSDRRGVETLVPERSDGEVLSPSPEEEGRRLKPEIGPTPPAGEEKRSETRSFLSRMFERRKAEALSKAEEEAEGKFSHGPERLRIVSCGQPRISPPAGLEIPLLLKVDGYEKSLSLSLKIQLDPTDPKLG